MAVGFGGIRREHSAVKDRGGALVSKISPGVLAPPHEVRTPDEWRARGRERRRSASRSSHAQWAPPADRPDPVTVLEEQAKTRVPGRPPAPPRRGCRPASEVMRHVRIFSLHASRTSRCTWHRRKGTNTGWHGAEAALKPAVLGGGERHC
jgi:hypothetical protein